MNGIEHEPLAMSWLRRALVDFYVQDRELLGLHVGETALTFRLGLHLARYAGTEWDVDAEYDRQGERGQQKLRDELPTPRRMRPDLLIHRRGRFGPSNNLLFVEVKRNWRTAAGDRNDSEKVHRAITRHGYQFAVVLGLTRPRASHRFSPTWSVYALPVGDHEHDSFEEPMQVCWAEAVFDGHDLDDLNAAANHIERMRQLRTGTLWNGFFPPRGSHSKSAE